MNCPCCGQRVKLYEGKEGTNSYIKITNQMLTVAKTSLKWIRDLDLTHEEIRKEASDALRQIERMEEL